MYNFCFLVASDAIGQTTNETRRRAFLLSTIINNPSQRTASVCIVRSFVDDDRAIIAASQVVAVSGVILLNALKNQSHLKL